MTTKFKIIFGFLCMMLLLAAGSFLGYTYLDKSVDGLVEYRRLARMNVRTSDSYMHLNAAALAVSRYTASRNPADAAAAKSSLDALDATLDAVRKDMTDTARIASVERTHASVRVYRESVDKLVAALANAATQYTDTVVVNSHTLGNTMQAISETAAQIGNINMLLAIESMWNEYGYFLSAIGRYYYGHGEEDRKLVEERVAKIRPALRKMDGLIRVPNVREMYDGKLLPAANSVFEATQALFAAVKNTDAATRATLDSKLAIETELKGLSDYYNQRMNAYGVAVTAESQSGQVMLLVGSAVGIVIGALLTLFIALGLIRVLRDLAGYAGSIAAGNFEYAVKTREKGEVGATLHAMHDIPEILQKLIDRANAVADVILLGNFRARLKADEFPGAFRNLAQCVTTVSDAYTRILDQIPLAIITADIDSKMLFINDTTKAVLGSDMTGRNCAACFKSPACNTDKCFATNAKNTKRPYTGETTIYPDSGHNLTISVTAIPFLDRQGTVRGHLEICSDITEMKKKQEAITNVAEQASTISNRIAAASEQLSAQVEQVSRGAEVQRDRVSSTAGAMTEMNSTVLEVARSAGEASEQSENTRQKAQQGADLVNQVVTAINSVNVIGQTLHTNMQELGKQAESIGGVMNVISDIADQTNLLALNAAIEAARAGEAGRGFAVVADEVRKLAEKTMQATHEVGSSINAVQQSAQTNIAEVDKAVASVSEADKLAISSGEALREIVNLAASNSSVVASIATAAEEQSATSEEISQSTEEINRIVAETAEGMLQSSAAVQELSHMAQELRRVMEGLK